MQMPLLTSLLSYHLLYLNPNRLSLTMAYKTAVEYFTGALRWKKTRIPSLAKVRSAIRSIDPKTVASARSYCPEG